MESIIGVRQAIKRGLNLLWKDENLGFLIKGNAAGSLLALGAALPILIGFFSWASFQSIYRVTPATTVETESASFLAPKGSTEIPQEFSAPGPFSIGMFVVGAVLMVGYMVLVMNMEMQIMLKISDNKTLGMRELIRSSAKKIPTMLGLVLIKIPAIFIGFLFFLVPGIILSLKWLFAEYTVLEENLGVFGALKRSSELTKGYRWSIYLKLAAIFLINVALFIPLIFFASVMGNTSVSYLLIIWYMAIVQLVFTLFYRDIVRIKADKPSENTTIVS